MPEFTCSEYRQLFWFFSKNEGAWITVSDQLNEDIVINLKSKGKITFIFMFVYDTDCNNKMTEISVCEMLPGFCLFLAKLLVRYANSVF